MPLVAMFKKFIQRLFYPTIDRIGQVTTPILLVNGLKDEIVPSNHSKRLFEAAKKAKFKILYECPDGDHNNTWKIGGEKYIEAFKEFFDKCEK